MASEPTHEAAVVAQTTPVPGTSVTGAGAPACLVHPAIASPPPQELLRLPGIPPG